MDELAVQIAPDQVAHNEDAHGVPLVVLDLAGDGREVLGLPADPLDDVLLVPQAENPPVEVLGVLDAEQDGEAILAAGLADAGFVDVVLPLRRRRVEAAVRIAGALRANLALDRPLALDGGPAGEGARRRRFGRDRLRGRRLWRRRFWRGGCGLQLSALRAALAAERAAHRVLVLALRARPDGLRSALAAESVVVRVGLLALRTRPVGLTEPDPCEYDDKREDPRSLHSTLPSDRWVIAAGWRPTLRRIPPLGEGVKAEFPGAAKGMHRRTGARGGSGACIRPIRFAHQPASLPVSRGWSLLGEACERVAT